MTKISAWTYLDTMVKRRNSITLSSRIHGGYAACMNGHYFGGGDTCKKAVIAAIKNSSKHRRRE